MSAQLLEFPIVLVVESEPSDRIVLHQAFERAQTKAIIYWAQNGVEAIRWLKSAAQEVSPLPDCIVVDMKVPVVGGTELLQYVRGNDALQSIPVIVLGDASKPAITAGAFDVKPFTFDSLVETSRAMGERWQHNHPHPVERV